MLIHRCCVRKPNSIKEGWDGQTLTSFPPMSKEERCLPHKAEFSVCSLDSFVYFSTLLFSMVEDASSLALPFLPKH